MAINMVDVLTHGYVGGISYAQESTAKQKTLIDSILRLREQVTKTEQALDITNPDGKRAHSTTDKVDNLIQGTDELIQRMLRINEALQRL